MIITFLLTGIPYLPDYVKQTCRILKFQFGCGNQCSQYYCCACFEEEEEEEEKEKAISEFSERGEFDVQKTI
jgi:hypothetical protein